MEDIPELRELSAPESTLEEARTASKNKRIVLTFLFSLVLSSVAALFCISGAFRGFILRHPGLLLVFFGVSVEVFFDWKDFRGSVGWVKKLAAISLVLGLAIEFWESAALDVETAKAINEAQIAKLAATKVENENLQLREKITAMEAKISPRKITTEQKKKFIELLNGVPRGEIRVMVRNLPAETITYTSQVCDMLESAGFRIANGRIERNPVYICQGKDTSMAVIIRTYETRPIFTDKLVEALKNTIAPDVAGHLTPTNFNVLPIQTNEVVLFINEQIFD